MRQLYFIICLLGISLTQAQNDSIYFWKSGTLLEKRSIKPADLDSITFKRPFANSLNIATVAIPAGTFQMGSPTNEQYRGVEEVQHIVTLDAFHMSAKEITCAQFAQFANTNNIEANGLWATGPYPTQILLITDSTFGLIYVGNDWVPAPGKANAPMTYVTWYGAASFAAYAGGRLPTESEWEYAARATTTTAFNTGACLGNSRANCDCLNPPMGCQNSGGSYLGSTQIVGSYAPNVWGLYDMHGNVFEWCSDWYGAYPTIPVSNPTGILFGTKRVLRGGGFGSDYKDCRSAHRLFNSPESRGQFYGFRIVF
jgi:formylglycine-generating enzyme required for sulfatase activity